MERTVLSGNTVGSGVVFIEAGAVVVTLVVVVEAVVVEADVVGAVVVTVVVACVVNAGSVGTNGPLQNEPLQQQLSPLGARGPKMISLQMSSEGSVVVSSL